MITSYYKIFFLALCILVSSPALAGDIIKEGTVLQEDSYVFTIEEAEGLLKRVEELEKKELLLQEYLVLSEVQSKQIDLYKINYEVLNSQIYQYESLIQLNENMLEKNRRSNNLLELKNWGIFTLGVAVTIGAFLAADRVADTMEGTY